ncbi:hypothetical protein NDU88_003055 [Pleurodeles waltl]|uniref:Uncharacterized protein n=1 Tax=Pleurodeles waltl TaxID=8319 RepID=A0AAV7WRY4_PLEWA|nr:hypothetical protein NDU88_003055 [Pleurodeles waltl]
MVGISWLDTRRSEPPIVGSVVNFQLSLTQESLPYTSGGFSVQKTSVIMVFRVISFEVSYPHLMVHCG